MAAVPPASRSAPRDRLDALDLDEPVGDEPLETICRLAKTALAVPFAVVDLRDRDRSRRSYREQALRPHTLDEPVLIEDALLNAGVADARHVIGAPFIRACLGIPLIATDGQVFGTLFAIDIAPRSFDTAQRALLADFAALATAILELRQTAATDQLTGAMSRREFLHAVEIEIARSRRYGHPAALALLDLDHFKEINDRHGHLAGDSVLRQFSARCARLLRPTDLFGRLGGEEFAILLPETGLDAARVAFHRLRGEIAAADFGEGDASIGVTASFGVAALHDDDTLLNWIGRADACLYAAKRAGRDRAVFEGEDASAAHHAPPALSARGASPEDSAG